jgi:hypothetical protein
VAWDEPSHSQQLKEPYPLIRRMRRFDQSRGWRDLGLLTYRDAEAAWRAPLPYSWPARGGDCSFQLRVVAAASHLFSWVNRVSVDRAAPRGHPQLRPVHGAVFVYLDLNGSHLVETARAAGLSKKQLGYVARSPAPTDGRAKILRYTDRGREMLVDAMEIGDEMNRELAELIGQDRVAALKDALDALAANGIDVSKAHFGMRRRLRVSD